MPWLRCALVAATLGLALPAWAEDAVYKCANGSYTSAPCAGGQKLDAADPRAAAQRRQAQEATARDAKLADKLAAQRQAEDRAAAKQHAGSLSKPASAPAKPASAPKKGHKKHGAKHPAPDDPNLSEPMRDPTTPAKKR